MNPLRLSIDLRSFGFAAGAALAALTGCKGATPPSAFPSKADLEQIAAKPMPDKTFERGSMDVEQWTLGGELPAAYDEEEIGPGSLWAMPVLDVIAANRSRDTLATKGMECVAREVALFVAEKSATPSGPLRAFMAARCGVPVSSIALHTLSGELPEDTPESDVLAKWQPQIEAAAQSVVGRGPRYVGVSFQRKGKRGAVVMASADRHVTLAKVPVVPEGGVVVVKGRLLAQAETVRALVTRGRFGYEACIKDVEVQPPNFAFECPVAADDAEARIEVAAFPADRELGNAVAELRVVPGGTPNKTYSHAPPRVDGFPADTTALAAALLSGVNAIRKEAGYSELRAATVQSATAARLAPYYFAGVYGGLDIAVSDKIALGMLAGWDVDGQVREGHFHSTWGLERDVGLFVDEVIATPFGRETLLDPSIATLAVGPYLGEGAPGFGAIFGTYAMIDTTGKTDNAQAVLTRLVKLRAKIKRPAPDTATELDGALEDVVAKVEGGQSLDDALKRLTERAVGSISRGSVMSWCSVASSVEKVEIPSELLSTPDLRLGIGVAKYRPEGAPWTRLAVFFVRVKEPPPTNVAKGAAGKSG